MIGSVGRSIIVGWCRLSSVRWVYSQASSNLSVSSSPSEVHKKRSTGINQDLDQRVDVWAVWVRCDTTGGEHSCEVSLWARCWELWV